MLRTNYRNTRQILDTARQLVAERTFTDLDTTVQPGDQAGEVLRDGPPVRVQHAPHWDGLTSLLRQAIRADTAAGIHPGEMTVLCHSNKHLDYLADRLTGLGIPHCLLADWTGEPDDRI